MPKTSRSHDSPLWSLTHHITPIPEASMEPVLWAAEHSLPLLPVPRLVQKLTQANIYLKALGLARPDRVE